MAKDSARAFANLDIQRATVYEERIRVREPLRRGWLTVVIGADGVTRSSLLSRQMLPGATGAFEVRQFCVPFCPRPGFQKRFRLQPFVHTPKGYLALKLHQKLHQIARRKGSKTSFLLRVFH
jgi:hypothetical protein